MKADVNLVVEWIVVWFLDGRVSELIPHLHSDDGIDIQAGKLHSFDNCDRNLNTTAIWINYKHLDANWRKDKVRYYTCSQPNDGLVNVDDYLKYDAPLTEKSRGLCSSCSSTSGRFLKNVPLYFYNRLTQSILYLGCRFTYVRWLFIVNKKYLLLDLEHWFDHHGLWHYVICRMDC